MKPFKFNVGQKVVVVWEGPNNGKTTTIVARKRFNNNADNGYLSSLHMRNYLVEEYFERYVEPVEAGWLK